jgi:hypothetical protein
MTSDFDHSGTLTNNLPNTAVIANPATAAAGLNLQATLVNAVQASAILSAVERNQKGTILESPTLVTLNGVRANTFMGIQHAYIGDYGTAPPAGTLDGTLDPEISILNLGASLDIKPYISADGKYVTMEFRPAIASLEQVIIENISVPRFYPTGFIPGGAGGIDIITGQIITLGFPLELPNVLVREVSTNITIPDGGTLLVSGLGRLTEQQTSSHIPFLGHILVYVNIRGDLEGGLILPGTIGAEEDIDHRDGSAVVLDHIGEEEPVKLSATGLVEFLQLRRREHSWHIMVHHMVARAVNHQLEAVDMHFRYRLLAGAEPLLHGLDFVLLCVDDARRQRLHLWTCAVCRGQTGHDEGLRMVRDHARHKVHIGLRETHTGTILPCPVERFQLSRGFVGERRGRLCCDGGGAATGRCAQQQEEQRREGPVRVWYVHGF